MAGRFLRPAFFYTESKHAMVLLAIQDQNIERELTDQNAFLEKTWDAILSRDKDAIQCVYDALDGESQKAIVEHLYKMATEEGWHPEQVKSAQIALRSLEQ